MKFLLHTVLLLVLSIPAHAQDDTALFDVATAADFNAVVYPLQSDSNVTREKVVIDGDAARIPFYRLQPGRDARAEYVILLHGLADSKEGWITAHDGFTGKLNRLRDTLLHLGYRLIIPDAPFHGERAHEIDFRPPVSLTVFFTQDPEDARTFRRLFAEGARDVRHLVTHIRATDPAARVHLLGYSMGAAVATLVNAADDRIASVTACVPPVNLPAREVGEGGWPTAVAAELAEVTPMTYAAQQRAPVAMLMGEKDFFSTREEAHRFFHAIPGERKQLTFYPSGHELPAAFIHDAVVFIAAHGSGTGE